jgi:hypothetical protein
MLYKYNKNKLLFEETYFPYIWKTLFFISLLFLLSSMIYNDVKYIQTEQIIIEVKEYTQKNIFKRIDELPFKYPDIVKAQVLLETGHLKSEVYKHNNNLFGMRLPRRRITTATGSNLNHATYNSIEDSIIDRLIYEVKYMSKLSEVEYYNFLDRLYTEGDNYSNKLKIIIKNNL